MRLEIPYYAQTTGFTCGSACLMMAMKFHRPEVPFDRVLELNLWKESTLVFTSSGLGGVGPHGLALAAVRRGYQAHILLSDRRTPFVYSVRREDKREIMRIMHRDMREKTLAEGVTEDFGDFRLSDLAAEVSQGWIPIVLISTWRLHGVRDPHWVVITGWDEERVFFLDPYLGFRQGPQVVSSDLSLPMVEFDRMRRHSKDVRKAAVLVGPPTGD